MSRSLAMAVASGQPTYTSETARALQAEAQASQDRRSPVTLSLPTGQGVTVAAEGEVLDQFVNRPSNTILLVNEAPAIQRAMTVGVPVAEFEGIELPEDFDSREKWPDLVTIAMDQGTCGSCWAFATALAIADRLRIAEVTGEPAQNPSGEASSEPLTALVYYQPPGTSGVSYTTLNNLDPYEMVFCDVCKSDSDENCDYGCNGGRLRTAYEFVQRAGLSPMLCTAPNCDPTQGTCPCMDTSGCMRYRPSEIYLVYNLTDDDEVKKRKIQEDVYQYGPVTVGFNVYNSFKEFFNRNPTGVYTESDATPSDPPEGHAVDIIGWGSQPVFHWIIRNSWSFNWGDGGVFRMQWNILGVLGECYAARA